MSGRSFPADALDPVATARDECDVRAAIDQQSDKRETQSRGATRDCNPEPLYRYLKHVASAIIDINRLQVQVHFKSRGACGSIDGSPR
jgi:hypothetical protein